MSSLFPEIARQLSNRYGEPEAGPLKDSSSKTEPPEKSTAPALLKSLKRTGERGRRRSPPDPPERPPV